MSAECFLDTNIIVYAFDTSSPEKQERARQLLNVDGNWVISWQVVQEFSSVALHRFKKPVSTQFLQNFNELVLWPKCVVMPSRELYQSALKIHTHTQYRFYDSLILAAALESGVHTLYSEDLQAGRQYGSITVENPFY